MVHAVARGLMLSDFHELSVGMILDYISCYDELHDMENHNENSARLSNQADFDAF
jgi:hypothetical protein